MHSHRSARYLLLPLVVIILLSSLLAGCQTSKPTLVSAATQNSPIIKPATPAPTHTRVVLPPTQTAPPADKIVEATRTLTPTPTATLNSPQTMVAISTNDAATKCNIIGDVWLVKISPSWKPGWCQVKSPYRLNYFYEYTLLYPAQWNITTFGDTHPNMAFVPGPKGIEVRLYQVYKYGTRTFTGSLKDAPYKAGFCDTADHCTPVVDPLEKILQKENRSIGGKDVLVMDSLDGKYNIRRYFFFVPFKLAKPPTNRLFFVKLYTPEPFNGTNYADIEQRIADIITSLKADF